MKNEEEEEESNSINEEVSPTRSRVDPKSTQNNAPPKVIMAGGESLPQFSKRKKVKRGQ